MKKAPSNPEKLMSFIDEIPYWTKEKHGKRYRLMYQDCMHPKYIEYGKQFFAGVNERYTAYAKRPEAGLGIQHTVLTPLIFILSVPVFTMPCLRMITIWKANLEF